MCVRYPPASGGVETHVYEISRRLMKRGHEILVATTDLDTEFPFRRLAEQPKDNGVLRFRAFNPLPFHYVMSPEMLRLMGTDYDLIHAHSYGYFHWNLATLISAVKGIPLVLTPHFHPAWSMIGGRGRRAFRSFYDRYVAPVLLKRCDVMIHVSKSEAMEMAAIRPRGTRVCIVPNGIDLEPFTPPPDGASFRARHDLQGPVLLFTGRMAKNKRLEHVIQILPSLVKEFPDLKLVAVGRDNGMRDQWCTLARHLNVSEHVLFLDHIPYNELVEAYGACDIYVLPSEYEAFGIVLLEAMASCRPVVASRVGGVSDVVVNGETGYLVRYGDRDAIKRALMSLLQDPELRSRFGRAGRQRVETRFTWDRVVDMLEHIYGELISR